jgi:hypothetical protein
MQISKIQIGKKLNVIFYQGICFMSPAAVINNSATRKGRLATDTSRKGWYSALESERAWRDESGRWREVSSAIGLRVAQYR